MALRKLGVVEPHGAPVQSLRRVHVTHPPRGPREIFVSVCYEVRVARLARTLEGDCLAVDRPGVGRAPFDGDVREAVDDVALVRTAVRWRRDAAEARQRAAEQALGFGAASLHEQDPTECPKRQRRVQVRLAEELLRLAHRRPRLALGPGQITLALEEHGEPHAAVIHLGMPLAVARALVPVVAHPAVEEAGNVGVLELSEDLPLAPEAREDLVRIHT